MSLSRDFYVHFLGMQVEMDMSWIVTLVSPTNPTAQFTLLRNDSPLTVYPDISVGVDDVDDVNELHASAITSDYQIVHPLTDESWGVRRFFVVDPNGLVLNIMSHVEHRVSQGS